MAATRARRRYPAWGDTWTPIPGPPRFPVAWLLVPAIIVIGGSAVFTMLAFVLSIVLSMAIPALVLFAAAGLIVRRRAPGTAPVARRPAEPPWPQARARFDALRQQYVAYECDPMEVLRLPALADVSVTSTGRFVEAFAEAQALETDARPPRRHAEAFIAAVERAERAWLAARDAAERIRLSGLSPSERSGVERAIKLLTTARDTDSDAERLTAYAMARNELARLERAGVIHMPRTAQAVLDAAGRGQLPA
ncbi:hypothetical protein [Pseudonocardia asaccharolytica]|uniref:Uncharacterized protein n=1 Tax=Pseudonocardia asaccharolytica DSM 44247 = NBRC 16224 TaxID=1123024 RepID=A0A511D8L7_9PSEU|nr:hypothetical protein [Pseudonocardia asaccharolytica]GEL19278.1 hypothetical protein PA7_31150 [Pseudonocardia asaccharolytica DSM 44247 = NBRC 16224]